MKRSKYESQKLYWESPRERRKPGHAVIKAFAEPKIRYMSKVIGKNEEGIPFIIGCRMWKWLLCILLRGNL